MEADQLAVPHLSRAGIRRAWVAFGGPGMGGTLARGAVWSFGINVGSTALGFLVQLLLTHSLSIPDYGTYVYVLAWINVGVTIGKLEFDPSSVRYVGSYAGTEQWSLLHGFLRRSQQIVWRISLGVAALAALAVLVLVFPRDARLAETYWMACVTLPLTARLLTQVGQFQGLKRVPQAQLPNLVVRPIIFGLSVGLLAHVIGLRLDATHALFLQLVATASALLLSTRLLRRATPPLALAAPPTYRTKEWLRTSVGLMAIAGANLVLSAQMDVLIVGTYLSASDAGVYGVANQLAMLIGFGVTGVLFIANPMISDLFARGRRSELQRLIVMATRANIAVALPAIPIIVLFGTHLLHWFGPAFEAGYPVLLILSFNIIVSATMGALAGFIMTMTGHQHAAAVIVCTSAALNIVLALVLTPAFGPVGTASATAIAGIVRAVILATYVWRRLGIFVLPFLPRGG